MKTGIQKCIQTEIGPLHLVASEKGLQGVFWKKRKDVPMAEKTRSPQAAILAQAEREIREYLSGKRERFDIVLDLEGMEFQKQVWKRLMRIPYGKTKSYAEIASEIKNEKACRAVGTANGKNPISIIIPCHRVIASNGSLGGYAGGLRIKTRLLEIEASTRRS
jgi:methylated-DNA-[protein]-cysteine S-methyltransferase